MRGFHPERILLYFPEKQEPEPEKPEWWKLVWLFILLIIMWRRRK